jgi:hypothetical protein
MAGEQLPVFLETSATRFAVVELKILFAGRHYGA